MSGLEPFSPPEADARPQDALELAAVWGASARLFKKAFLFPAIVLAVIAGLAGALMHVGGLWAITPVVHGRYVVWAGTVALAFGLPMIAVLVPSWLAFRALLKTRRNAFLRRAAKRGVDVEELAGLARALE